ncbi:hypothetical protein PA598K_07136, partial [Paenibacillus sp. 598K]|uniref:hypothetical protein n=1 Tax=Paenibacillus sp. 598K TaxID=1117987 RepID=UPI000FFA60EA
MKFQLVRYYLIDLFHKFKYVFVAVILITAVIVALQYAPARELGKGYTHLSEQFWGPFSVEKDKKMEELIDKQAEMSSTAYDELQSKWFENFANPGKDNSRVNEESELWEESQKFLHGNGEYGKTIYDDMMILSALINSYRDLSQVEDKKAQMLDNIRRNMERSNQEAGYWGLLMEKSKNLKKVEYYDMRPVNAFLESYATDWMFLFILIIMLSTIFCGDYEKSRHLLLFSMPISPVKIGLHKIFCSIFIALLCLVSSTIINLSMLFAHTKNLHSLSQAVQAVGSMSNSLFSGTLLEYIFLLILYKTIFYIFIAVVVTLVSMFCRKMVY